MFDDVFHGGFNNLSITGGNMQLNNENIFIFLPELKSQPQPPPLAGFVFG
jgi:hypothetical protein